MFQTTSILLVLIVLIDWSCPSRSHSFYLIDLDPNYSSCSNISINKTRYGIPRLCQKHLLCHRSHCDDQSFRCVKIRETLCCLSEYIEKFCSNNRLYKDRFRSIYFHMSIEHGYCEINLERIEQNDSLYCLANQLETTTIADENRSIFSETTTNLPATSSVIQINTRILILIMIFFK